MSPWLAFLLGAVAVIAVLMLVGFLASRRDAALAPVVPIREGAH